VVFKLIWQILNDVAHDDMACVVIEQMFYLKIKKVIQLKTNIQF
jgi:hypothetical protein